jgi:chromosome segregation ATPase
MATITDIHAIADRLAEAGQRPTLAAVRKELGGGSFTTISEAMKSWHDAQQQEHALGEVQVPESISERLSQLQAALWQAAMGEAERRLAAEREDLAQAREEARAQVSEAQEALDTLEAEACAREQQIEQLHTRCRELEAQSATAAAGRAQAEQAAAAAQATASAQLEGLEARLADARATIDALVARIGEDKEPPARGNRKR